MFPSVCLLELPVGLLTGAQPWHVEPADSVWLLPQLWAAVAAVTTKPSTLTHSMVWYWAKLSHSWVGGQSRTLGWGRGWRTASNTRLSGLLFMEVTHPVKQWKLLMMLKAFISHRKCNRSTQSMHFQQCQLATLCCPLCSLNQTVTVSHWYTHTSVLRLSQLALIPF